MKNDGKFANIVTQLQGQAGVWAVAAQLAIRGHIPIFPGVDYGWDLMIENGLRLQVKTARLYSQRKRKISTYPGYQFNLTKTRVSATKCMKSVTRDWRQVADFFVLWGVDENRFWIVPTTERNKRAIRFCQYEPIEQDVTGRLKGGKNLQYAQAMQRKAAYEGRWDLLDLNTAIESTVKEQVLDLEEKI